ncbi:phosphotransferase family protein [Deinococcus hohokamensis]|uniref:Phosphotransferase family protein n=1 Tax=Deinococcus hohokamensis TaxID=309883 RepID=A0ABV9I5V4_9DEIO
MLHFNRRGYHAAAPAIWQRFVARVAGKLRGIDTPPPWPERPSFEEFAALHAQALDPWQGLLSVICERHGLDGPPAQRFRLGKNVVFARGDVVIKLVPWQRAGEARRERAALLAVSGRLKVQTPALVAAGTVGAWSYLVTSRLPGRPLAELWPDLQPPDRQRLSVRQAELTQQVHHLNLNASARQALAFDWAGLLCLQAMELPGEWRGPPELLAQARSWIESVFWQGPGFGADPVLLHGDLNFLNLLVERQAGRLEVTGLLDWGDARWGPAAHDLISPAVNQFRRDASARRAWSAALGLEEGPIREATARAMLYYPDMWSIILDDLGVPQAASWTEVGAALFGLSSPDSG